MINPLRRILTVSLFLFATTLSAKDKEPTNFILYYQPLFEFSDTLRIDYIKKLKAQLSKNSNTALDAILAPTDADGSQSCKSRRVCDKALYEKPHCLPEKTSASEYCLKKTQRVDPKKFNDPVFNRMDWNRLAVKINQTCNKKLSKECIELQKLSEPFWQAYQKMVRKEIVEKADKIERPK